MTRTHVVLATGASLALALAGPAVAAKRAGGNVLQATDGPGFTISLTQGGKPVKALKPGAYTIKVADRSNIHNFHLKGPGVDLKTDIKKVYATTWKVTLKKGKYTYVCDPHVPLMNGSFTVG